MRSEAEIQRGMIAALFWRAGVHRDEHMRTAALAATDPSSAAERMRYSLREERSWLATWQAADDMWDALDDLEDES